MRMNSTGSIWKRGTEIMKCKEKGGKTWEYNPVFRTLNQFYNNALTRRDAQKAAALVTEDVYFLGASEVVFGREVFRQFLEGELNSVKMPILYQITDYREKERGSHSWDCYCQIEIAMQGKEHHEHESIARVTASVVEENGEYKIAVLHRTLLEGYIQKEERFPFRILSNRLGKLDQISRRELLDIICETMPSGVIGGYMEDGFPIYMVNDKLLDLLGYTYEEFMQVTGGNVLNRIWKKDQEEAIAAAEKECQEHGEYEIEYRMMKKDGNFVWVYDRGRVITTQDGRRAVISLIVDISENVRIKNNLFVESVTDPLTGLYNRRGGEVMVTQKLGSGKPYIFLMLDIDRFKEVNDFYGHHEGDNVLKYVAEELKHCFRRDDVIIRLGGDEFVIFVHPCTSISAIENKLAGISTVYQEKIDQEYPKSKSSLSFGGIYADHGIPFVELYKKADQILYGVKQQCKGTFRIVNAEEEKTAEQE